MARRTAAEETERLRVQFRESERQNRQGTYHRLLAYLSALDSWARNVRASQQEFEELSAEFDFLHGGIFAFWDAAVTEAMGPVVELLERIGAREGPTPGQDMRRRQAYHKNLVAFVNAQSSLVAAMRADLDQSAALTLCAEVHGKQMGQSVVPSSGP